MSNNVDKGLVYTHQYQVSQQQPQQHRQQKINTVYQQPRNEVHQSRLSRPPRQEHQQSENYQSHHVQPHVQGQVLQVQQQHPSSDQVHNVKQQQSHSLQPPPKQLREVIREQKSRSENTDVEECLNTEKDLTGGHRDRRFQQPLRRVMDVEELHLPEGTLAHSMTVEKLIIHFTPKANGNPLPDQTTTLLSTNNNIVDLVTFICSNWKRQCDALALTPVEQLEFYKRQYDQLLNVLSISLFNQSPNSNIITCVTATKHDDKSAKEQHDKPLEQKKQTKKRNAPSPNNDYEIIVFEHDEKKNRYLYRRVESVEKYAKRKKIPRYIRITVRNEETKNLIASLRTIDPTFVVGKEIRYSEGHSLSGLHKEMRRRIEGLSLENKPNIELVEDNSVASQIEVEADISPPPAKRTKTTSKKQTTITPKTSTKGTNRIVENTRPSGVEMTTDIEDECNEDDDDDDDDEEGHEKKKGNNNNNNDENSESDDDTSDSDSDNSSNDEDDQAEVVSPVMSHIVEEYVPNTKTDQLPTSSCYIATPKTPVNKSYSDLPPSPLLADINTDRKCDRSPGSLFSDTQAVNKKRKHH